MSDSAASVIYDETSEQPIGVILDGTVYRLQVETTIAPGQSVNIGGAVPDDVSQIFREYCEDGGSEDLRVDGSSTPVDFEVNADPSDDILINEIRFLLTVNNFKERGDKFGNGNALSNGILLQIRSNSIDRDLATIKISEHFREFFSPAGTTVDRTSSNDVVSAGLYLGGAIRLMGGSGDYVRVRIRDDLSGGDYKYFTCTVHGTKVS